jgi:hypothetical protein
LKPGHFKRISGACRVKNRLNSNFWKFKREAQQTPGGFREKQSETIGFWADIADKYYALETTVYNFYTVAAHLYPVRSAYFFNCS